MDDDHDSLESVEGTDDDQLDPFEANDNNGSIRSGGDPDDREITESVDDEQ